jgi:choice-of-anchor A domain-containing protein
MKTISLILLTICFSVNTFAQNPLAEAKNFMIFVEQNATVGNGDVTGPMAVGGNLTTTNAFGAGANYQGTYQVSGDSKKVGIWIGGTVLGSSLNNSNGDTYFKIKTLGSNSISQASNILEIKKSNGTALLKSSNSQPQSSISIMGTLNMATAFTKLRNNSLYFGSRSSNVSFDANNQNPTINCTNSVNYLSLTTSQMNGNYNVGSNADATHLLIINVNCNNTTFTWDGMFRIQNTNPDYTIINFYNATTVNMNRVGGHLNTTILAPNANFTKASSDNIEGHLVAKNYTHGSGEVHNRPFLGSIANLDASVSSFIGGTLAVTLGELTASTNNSIATIKFNVYNEVDILNYVVEKSNDGLVFTTHTTIAAIGNTYQHQYQCNDNLQGITTNKVYYRIKVISKNNNIQYSNIVFASLKNEGTVNVFPNPAMNYTNVTIKSQINGKVQLQLIDANGQKIREMSTVLTAGTNQVTFSNLGNIPAGNYTIVVNNNQQNQVVRFQKR